MSDTLKYGYTIPQVMMPASFVHYRKWAVVACDQYTSQPEYWKEVARFVGSSPSAYHIILPEVFLGENDVPDRIARMKRTMRDYVENGVVENVSPGIVLTERYAAGKTRRGILLAMDLEAYDWDIDNKPMIRSSESTVMERIPARVRIRKDAWLELPHIMLLIDDPSDRVIGSLHMERGSFRKLYDFDLMMDGGHVQGWLVRDERVWAEARNAISELKRHDNMLYCVGDGNHSLATAKTIWDETKESLPEAERESSPLRFALCEIVNLRDPAIEFLPIHRVFFNVNPVELAEYVTAKLNQNGRDARLVYGRAGASGVHPVKSDDPFTIPFNYRDGVGRISIGKPRHPLALGEVQPIFDDFVREHPNVRLDYIHGDDAYLKLCQEYNVMGFFFPPLQKEDFFDTVTRCGVLPRKTFSIGEPDEKRYYLESRLLRRK